MNLIVRAGVTEMFARLSSFCIFYAYSHGLKSYIMKILDKIDPEKKFFQKRDERVIAPLDQMQQ